MPIGAHIRRLREKAGRSQTWLGEKVGVGQTTISSWESGRTEPSRSDTRKVAQALSVDISLLELGDKSAAATQKSDSERFNSLYGHGFVRVAACAPVVSPADPVANADAILKFWREADAEKAAILLTPELSLSGYAIDDLLLQEPLLDAVEAAIAELKAESEKPLSNPRRRRAAALQWRDLQLRRCYPSRPRARRRAEEFPAELSRVLREALFRCRRRHRRRRDPPLR